MYREATDPGTTIRQTAGALVPAVGKLVPQPSDIPVVGRQNFVSLYDEAKASGTTVRTLAGGILPPIGSFRAPPVVTLPSPFNASSFLAEPPRGATGTPSPFPADVSRPLPSVGPSVVGTVTGALVPVKGLVSLAGEIPGAAKKPLLPAGLAPRIRTAVREAIEPNYHPGQNGVSSFARRVVARVSEFGRR